MLYNYNIEEINLILQDFYNATGVNISFIDLSNTYMTSRFNYNSEFCKLIQKSEKLKNKCICSDICLFDKCKNTKKPEKSICHAGLIDVAVPLINDEEVLGYFIMGQMKKDCDFSIIQKKLSITETESKNLKEIFDRLPVFDEDKVKSIINLATITAKHILSENAIKPKFNQIIESSIRYIDENFENDLSINEIANKTNISVSALYKYFKLYFNCTPKDYINGKRIEKSKFLLKNTNKTVEDISRSLGFSSASYYTKVFKALNNVTPLKFRKG